MGRAGTPNTVCGVAYLLLFQNVGRLSRNERVITVEPIAGQRGPHHGFEILFGSDPGNY